MKRSGTKCISCLASDFEQPIADLVDRLLTIQLPEFPDDSPRNREVAYATSLVVLLVIAFEGWISRARFFDSRTPANKGDKKFVVSWMKSLRNPKLQTYIIRLKEIYFLRDAIVHNHIWTYTQRWVHGRPQYSNFDLDLTWQSESRKVQEIVKGKLPLPSFPRTKKLSLIIVPTFVGRKDVAIVFTTVKDTLKIVDELGYVEIVPKVPYVRFDGKLSFPFWGLISKLQRSSLAQRGHLRRQTP